MRIEQRIDLPPATREQANGKTKPKRGIIATTVYNASAETATFFTGPIIRHWTERLIKGTQIDYAPGFDDKFTAAIEDNCLIILAGNHLSQFDADILAETGNDLKERAGIDEILMPLAKSMETGDQGFWPFVMYKSTKQILSKRHLRPVPTATDNDINIRHVEQNSEEFAMDMQSSVRKGRVAIAVLPEKSVEGGRINPKTGQLNGTQMFDPRVLRMGYLLGRQNHRQVAIVPLSITRSQEVFSPQTRRPGGKALLAGLHLANPSIAKAYVGAPIRSDQELKELIGEHDWNGVSAMVAREITKHLPPEQRGIYA